jgi:hypothetical protein
MSAPASCSIPSAKTSFKNCLKLVRSDGFFAVFPGSALANG